MVDLLPADRKWHEDEDDDSVLPRDWLECTSETHPSLDWRFGPGMWKCLMMGDLIAQYGSFYTDANRQFSNIHGQSDWDHWLENEEKVKALQVINITSFLQTLS